MIMYFAYLRLITLIAFKKKKKNLRVKYRIKQGTVMLSFRIFITVVLLKKRSSVIEYVSSSYFHME